MKHCYKQPTMKFFIFAVLIALAKGEEDGKIVGGDIIDIKAIPFQAAIIFRGGPFCGGSILNEEWILTAAHCLPSGVTSDDYQVRVGSTDQYNGGQLIDVEELLVHPDYRSDITDCDVALLRLKPGLKYNDSVKNVRITNYYTQLVTNAYAYVSGWGALNTGGGAVQHLRYTYLYIVDFDTCNENYGHTLTENMFCASATGRDSCQGDSGGPLFRDNVQYGIVSFGRECASDKDPGVYTNIASHKVRSFINHYTGL